MDEVTIHALLTKYDRKSILGSKRLIFKGIVNLDVYNITAPFAFKGREYILGRVEHRQREETRSMFFYRTGENEYTADAAAPVLDIQDPFITVIEGTIIIGGVQIGTEGYYTTFYSGKDFSCLTLMAKGPAGMKDIRLVPMPDSRIGIFTRPQGIIGGRGRIGFMAVSSIAQLVKLREEDYNNAPLLPGRYSPEEWLGVNSAYTLSDGRLGILGHIAGLAGQYKNYYPITFIYDLKANRISDFKIIATRDDLPGGDSKTIYLKNVLFSGGLVRNANGTANLYIGVGDAEAYEVTLHDPFA